MIFLYKYTNKFFALILIIIFLPIIIFVSIIIKISSEGPVIYWSKRIGLDSQFFFMPKFRTMKVDTPNMATHLLNNKEIHLTVVGGVIRKLSIDEIPQLYSVILGDMVFVGPRPALFNQYELIQLRKEKKIDKILPGITGWAQINGRDEISTKKKVELDSFYLDRKSILFDCNILWLTVIKVIKRDNITH